MRAWMNRLWKDEAGASLVFFGLAVLMLVAAVGSAIDMARAQTVRTKLAVALDAAGLAAGATMNTQDIQAEAQKYFNVNFNASQFGATVVSMTAVPNSDNTLITLNATVTLPTTLMKVVGFGNLTMKASSEITRVSKGMELALVLDVTYSMVGQPLTDLKAAANSLMTILYGTKSTIDNLWVAVVPFSQAVNIGPSRTGWLDATHYNSLVYSGSGWTTSWAGCVDARTGGNDMTDVVPSVAPFKATYYPDTSSGNGNNWLNSSNQKQSCAFGVINGECGPNLYCANAITPLTPNKATVVSAINALFATGGTHINLGMVWGWRVLSPAWRGLWGGETPNTLPLNYKTDLMEKVVVLMTDGDNTAYADSVDRTAYGFLSEGRLGTTSSTSTAAATLDSKLASLCTTMKASDKKIIIYTIAFNNPDTSTKNMLKTCASKPEYFFDSPTGTALQTAFKIIGDSLANLHISK